MAPQSSTGVRCSCATLEGRWEWCRGVLLHTPQTWQAIQVHWSAIGHKRTSIFKRVGYQFHMSPPLMCSLHFVRKHSHASCNIYFFIWYFILFQVLNLYLLTYFPMKFVTVLHDHDRSELRHVSWHTPTCCKSILDLRLKCCRGY
jgi:hypothetical protein